MRKTLVWILLVSMLLTSFSIPVFADETEAATGTESVVETAAQPDPADEAAPAAADVRQTEEDAQSPVEEASQQSQAETTESQAELAAEPSDGPGAEEPAAEPSDGPGAEEPAAEPSDGPGAEELAAEPSDEPAPFRQGYVRVQPGTTAYKAANKQEEAGTFDASAVVYAKVATEGDDLPSSWLKLTFDTENAKQSGAAFGAAYVLGKDIEVLEENAVEQLSVQWSQDRTMREYDGHPLPVVNFTAKAEASAAPAAEATDSVITSASSPTITKQPASVTVASGETVSFIVTASGTGLQYQWYYRTSSAGSWKALSTNAKTSVYSMKASVSCHGYQYRCVVSNSSGSVTTNTATLRIEPPAITTQPFSVTVTPGTTASFIVTASGDSLSYQWYYRTSSSGTWAALSTNARSPVYSMKANAACNGYQYRCVVSNSAGTVTSNTVKLTVNTQIVAPKITKQPSSVTVDPGTAANFSVAATGTNLSYQWYYRTSSSGTWAALSTNARSPVYSMKANAACNGYQYKCVVSNSAGNVTSNTVTLKLVTPKITNQPVSVTVDPGDAVNFSLTATGKNLSYQWYYRTSGSGTWAALSTNAKSSVYSMKAKVPCNGYQYKCVVSNGAASVTSNVVTLKVRIVPPKITKQPVSVEVSPGTTVSFSVTASGDSLTYQWQYRTSSSGTWKNLSVNAKSPVYSMKANGACNGYQYRCVVYSSTGNVTSDAATLKVRLDLSSISYSFGNNNTAFGYSSYYRIPLERYRRFFTSSEATRFYNSDGTWGGNCFGMSSTASMLSNPGANMSPSWFGRTYNRNLKVSDYSSKMRMSVTAMIEYAQVMQHARSIQNCYNHNASAKEVYNAMSSAQYSGDIVLYSIWQYRNGYYYYGHTIAGYKLQKVSSTESRVYVYDPNYPLSTNRYITIRTNTSGTPTSWSYYINDAHAANYISIVPYSTYRAVWQSGSGLSTYSALLDVSADNYEIRNAAGELVAWSSEGVFQSNQSDIYQFRGVDTSSKIIYIPSGVYTVTNTDGSAFSVDMVNKYRSATVSTSADTVTIRVQDADALASVDILADQGETYTVRLESENDTYKTVEYSGNGDGSGVTLTVWNGDLQLSSASKANLRVNGITISSAGTKTTNASPDENMFDYTLLSRENASVTVAVKNLQRELFDGEFVLVAYDADENQVGMTMRHVKLDGDTSEALTLTGIANAVEIKAYMLQSDTFTQIGNEILFK